MAAGLVCGMRPLSLDHITAVDMAPEPLARCAAEAGYTGICLFMQSMDVLPRMPQFDLVADRARRADFRRLLGDLGVSLDLVYPFTLSGRTVVSEFAPAMECAAELGAGRINALLYDRDPARRLERFAGFAELAHGFELPVAVEFYPVSQVRSLADALALIAAVNRPGLGVNADLLHLMRSGGSIDELTQAAPGAILYGQVCDGPVTCDPDRIDTEASSARLLPGSGTFDIARFVAALPGDCPVSIEVPREDAIAAGIGPRERARSAIAATRRVLGDH